MGVVNLTLIYVIGAIFLLWIIELTANWIFNNKFFVVFIVLFYPVAIIFAFLFAPLIYILRSVNKNGRS